METKRIPKSIRILGDTIRIKQVTVRELSRICGDDRVLDGLWVDSEKTIYLNKNLSNFGKRQTCFHELIHAIVDLKECG